MKRRETFGPGDLNVQAGFTSNMISGGASEDYDTLKEIEEKVKSNTEDIEQNKTDISLLKKTTINGVSVSGELDSQTDLKVPGKIATGTVYQINNEDVTAADGAEVFNSSNNKASGSNSHAEGSSTTASGISAHAEGGGTTAIRDNSHAEGSSTTASGISAHAEGGGTTASGPNSHAEGASTKAIGDNSHAEGAGTKASGSNSHAEGSHTTASGDNSHAEGSSTTASGISAHAEGAGTTASSNYQHVQGKCNVEDADGKYAFIIGNGEDINNRSNAIAIDWDGKFYINNSETGIDLNDLLNRIIALENK